MYVLWYYLWRQYAENERNGTGSAQDSQRHQITDVIFLVFELEECYGTAILSSAKSNFCISKSANKSNNKPVLIAVIAYFYN